jgi:hypothetical protein
MGDVFLSSCTRVDGFPVLGLLRPNRPSQGHRKFPVQSPGQYSPPSFTSRWEVPVFSVLDCYETI